MKTVFLSILKLFILPEAIFILFIINVAYTENVPFVTVSGTEFRIVPGSFFKFIGANIDPWRFMTGKGEKYSKSEIEEWVADAVLLTGSRVVRMHMNGGAFEPEPGKYNEQAFEQLDYLLSSCAVHHVFLIIALRDYLWGPWPPDASDPYWYVEGGGPDKDSILKNEKAKNFYKSFIKFALNRTNTVSGLIYKDDPSIFGWELINEPKINTGIKAWFREFGDFVKSIDQNHLVSVGVAGSEAAWWEPGSKNWSEIDVPQLDFIDLHYYADPSNYMPVDNGNISRLKCRVRSVLALKKPVIIGEFGCTGNNPAPTILNLYKTVLGTSFGEGSAGAIFYSWGPPGPHGWGGKGSFNLYTNDTELCALIKNFAP